MHITVETQKEKVMFEGFLRSLEENNQTNHEYEPFIQTLKDAVIQEGRPSTDSDAEPEVSLSSVCNQKNAWEISDCWNEDVPE